MVSTAGDTDLHSGLNPPLLKAVLGGSKRINIVKADDVVIVLWGAEGSGKSTFLSTVANFQPNAEHDEDIDELRPVRMARIRTNKRDIVLVDFPGFDTSNVDMSALDRLSRWLQNKYTNPGPLAGVLYFEKIGPGQPRRGPVHFMNLLMFQVRCRGQQPLTAFLVTTMWDKIDNASEQALTQAKSVELQLAYEYWNKACISQTAEVHRFDDRQETGLKIIDDVLAQHERTRNPLEVGSSQLLAKAIDIELSQVGPDDSVILLMGATGSGKSTFIKFAGALDDLEAGVGHHLRSETDRVRVFRIESTLLRPGRAGVVLVDTPGFFDSNGKPSKKTLQEISDWVGKLQKRHAAVSTILYFHKISDNRVEGHTTTFLKTFIKFVKNRNVKNVCMVTTMWDIDFSGVGDKREEELKTNYWATLIKKHGFKVTRFKRSVGSALEILRDMTRAAREADDAAIQKMASALPSSSMGRSTVELITRVASNSGAVHDRIADVLSSEVGAERLTEVMREYRSLQDDARNASARANEGHVQLGGELGHFLETIVHRLPEFLRDLFAGDR